MKTSITYLIVLFVFISTSCSKKDPPVIAILTASPMEIFTEEESVLYCEAEGSSDTQVKYKWIYDQGEIIGNDTDQSITWIAPSEPGAYKISVEVSVGNASTVGSLTVNVAINNIQYFQFQDPRDSRTYSYINYKGQSWMAENLAFLPFVRTAEEESLYEPHYYVYNYQGNKLGDAKELDNFSIYGVLYNWPAAQTACPAGWRLPDDEDWKILEKNLGMTKDESEGVNWRDSGDVGKMLKAKEGWVREGNGFNRIGFKALPGGSHPGGKTFGFIQNKAWFWTSTSESFDRAWYRNLYYGNSGIYRYHFSRDHGCSVRCIKAD